LSNLSRLSSHLSLKKLMTILEKIIENKRREVAERHELVPVKKLERSEHFAAPIASLVKYLHRPDKVGIIAEIKRRSPSKGVLNEYISIEKLSIGYMQAGASALSVLTDAEFFGGSNEDLITARKFNYCPILRKDFIVDEYQIVESRAIGADAILLIAAVLSEKEIKQFAAFAASLGLEVLLEIHSLEELPPDLENINIIGVNNRDLSDFTTDINRSFEIAEELPDEITKISESGISEAETILKLKKAGFQGFLIGEAFMRNSRPEAACAEFIRKIKEMETTDEHELTQIYGR
jgi:indole-3-glycerol phosphate synthase